MREVYLFMERRCVDMPLSVTPNIRGKAFELLVKRLLLSCNFAEVAPDGIFVYDGGPGIMLQGIGQPHNADVLVEPPFQTPFYFPSRLLVECKCYKRAVDLSIVRGVLGLRDDINRFEVVTEDILKTRRSNATREQKYYPMKRYHYQVAIAAMHGFTSAAIPFALAHRIPLISFGQSSLFRPICYHIDEMSNVAKNDRVYGKRILAHFERESRPCPGEDDLLFAFFNCLDKLEKRVQIGLLEDGTMLFLLRCDYRPSCCNYNDYYDDGYTLHWDNEGKFWYLINGDECYAFELPEEMYRAWMLDVAHRRENAINLKVERFGKIVLFGNRKDGHAYGDIIRILHLSESFISEAIWRMEEDRR